MSEPFPSPLRLAPLVALDPIGRPELNACLLAWGHRMGPWRRPTFRNGGAGGFHHGLRVCGELVAVLAAGDLIRETAGGFTRADAFELGRVCAVSSPWTTAALRLWREAVFPELCAAYGWRWAISYQTRRIHTGGLYRYDGWVWLGASSSGTDGRSGRVGRPKTIWGWCADRDERLAVAEERAQASVLPARLRRRAT